MNQTKHRLTIFATIAAFIFGGCASLSIHEPVRQAAGPLRVHPTNPRYFTDGTKNADGKSQADDDIAGGNLSKLTSPWSGHDVVLRLV